MKNKNTWRIGLVIYVIVNLLTGFALSPWEYVAVAGVSSFFFLMWSLVFLI